MRQCILNPYCSINASRYFSIFSLWSPLAFIGTKTRGLTRHNNSLADIASAEMLEARDSSHLHKKDNDEYGLGKLYKSIERSFAYRGKEQASGIYGNITVDISRTILSGPRKFIVDKGLDGDLP